MPKSKISKSSHHKNENQYKFLTLAERISNIKADVSKRIKRIDDKSEVVAIKIILDLKVKPVFILNREHSSIKVLRSG